MPKNVRCPHCGKMVKVHRDKKGRWVGQKRRWVAPVVGGAGGGTIGAVIGSSIGIAALGTAIVGTLPVALVGITVGGLAGHLVGKWREKMVKCPECKKKFNPDEQPDEQSE